MWLLVLPLGFCWNSPNHVTPPPPPPPSSPSPPHLRQENRPAPKSCHDFRANGHISLPPTICLSSSLSPARAGLPQAWVPWVLAPRTAPLTTGCCRPGPALAVGQNAQLCVPHGRRRKRVGIRRNVASAPHLPVSPFQGPPTPLSQPPRWEKVREEQTPGAPTCTASWLFSFSHPGLSSRPRGPLPLSVWSTILSGCPHPLLLPSADVYLQK